MSNDDLIIGALIGRGTYSDVHLGFYRGSQVAIKKCRMLVDQQYSVYREKCNCEASLLKSLQHENVLRFIGTVVQYTEKAICLIVEYVDGGSMERFCKNGTILPDADKKRIACSCWRGLGYLHEKKICHKDIKPDNILISNDLLSVKICDFGLAEFKNLTQIYSTNSIEGTIMYLPPEIVSKGSKKPYRRHPQNSDVYSMGATLCVFFSGKPFWKVSHKQEVMVKLIAQWEAVQTKTAPEEPYCWQKVSKDVQNILIHAINADYSKRKSAHELFDLFKETENLQIRELIGRGSYADVYEGAYYGQKVAIKICELAVTTLLYSEYRMKCLKEAAMLKSLQHDNIIQYIDIVEKIDKEQIHRWIIMEYIDGGTMERFCKPGRSALPDTHKKRIACSCWSGLAYLHERNICHKDIKPENILISSDLMTVKMGDFGFAELKDQTTVYFLHIHGRQEKGDVYLMGVTLCEFFSDQPFQTFIDRYLNPLKSSCWKAINVDIQNILIHAIAQSSLIRNTSYEMLKLFKKVN